MSSSTHLAAALSVLLLCLAAHAKADEFTPSYGVGINTATNDIRGNCIDFQEPPPPDLSAVKDLAWSFKMIERQEELLNTLGISAGAALRGLWGQGEAKVAFSQRLQVQQYSLFMLLKGEVRAASTALQNAHIKPEIKKLLDTRRLTPRQFFAQCGDAFVSAVQQGGSVYSVIVIDTRSQSEKTALSASLNASWGAGKVDSILEKAFERTLQNRSYHVEYFQEGGTASASAPGQFQDLAAFFDYVRKVSTQIVDHPTVVAFRSLSYRTIDGRLSSAPALNQHSALRDLARISLDLQGIGSSIQRVLDYPSRFHAQEAQLSSLGATKATIQTAQRELQDLAEDCFSDEAACDASSVTALAKRSQDVAKVVLPKQDPLYPALELVQYNREPQSYHWDDHKRCKGDSNRRLILGQLQIVNDSRLIYPFICELTHQVNDCGGGPDRSEYDDVKRVHGVATADLGSDRGLYLQVINIQNTLKGDNDCAAELVRFLASKNNSAYPQD